MTSGSQKSNVHKEKGAPYSHEFVHIENHGRLIHPQRKREHLNELANHLGSLLTCKSLKSAVEKPR
jgi:hypothetical protein